MGKALFWAFTSTIALGAATADVAAAQGPVAIEEIVVTAQKRTESAQDIPVTVSAVDGELLERTGTKDLFQAVTLVPGVVFSRAPDDGLALTFRGLGSQARPQAFEQSVALFTDGVFIGKGRLYSTSFFDVDRMEFIKGTQSTLLGKNASTGAISVITRQPGDAASMEGRVGYELENGGYTADLAGDIPLGDKAALRLAGHYNDLNGWVHNTTTGEDGPRAKDAGVRATLRVEPTSGVRLTGSYQYADNERIGSNYQLFGPTPAFLGEGNLDDTSAAFTSRGKSGDSNKRTRSHIASLKGEVEYAGHTLISQSAYIEYRLRFRDDFDFSNFDSVSFLRDETYRQYTQEFRIQSPAGRAVDYMAGVFFLDSRWRSAETQVWGVPAFPPPPAPISGQLFNGPFTNTFVQDQTAYSAFASGTWRAADTWRVTGGLRWTREKKDIVYGRTNSLPLTIWNTVANPPFDPTPLKHDADFVDGNVSVQHDLSEDLMVYAAYGHGSKSGGFVETNSIAVDPALIVNGKVPAALVRTGSQIRDEFTNSYEVGLKSTLLDRRLRLNVALFRMDIRNFQDTVFTGGPLGFITFNGPAESQGVEVEAALQATEGLRFDGGFTYADATQELQPIDAAGTPEIDAAGRPVIRTFRRSQAPKFIANLGANYEAALTDTLRWRAGFSVRHRSSMYNQRQEQFLAKPLTTLDLTLGLDGGEGRWSVDLVGKNVTNAVSADFGSPAVDPRTPPLAGPAQLRTILLSASFKY